MTRPPRAPLAFAILLCGFIATLAYTTPHAAADTVQDIGIPALNGFPVRLGGTVTEGSVTIADITGDNKPEIIVGDVNGVVYAVSGTGQVLWQFQTDSAINNAWSGRKTPTRINSAPAVGDIDGDGSPDIVVGVGGVTIEYRDGKPSYENGGVVALDSRGRLKAGWPQLTVDIYEPFGYTEGVTSSPVIADFTGDGLAEVAYGGFDQYIYMKDGQGRNLPGWPIFARDTVWSSPAAIDLDGNGKNDLVIGIDAHDYNDGRVRDYEGGYLLGLRSDGTELPNWRIFQDDVVFSSPAVADLDEDGKPEIIIGSGNFWSGHRNNPNIGRTVTAYRTNGSVLWQKRTDGTVSSAPAIGDVNGDGKLDVVIVGDDGDDQVYVFNGRDGNLIWKKLAKNIFTDRANGNVILGDYDGDGINDIFVPVGGQVAIIRGRDGFHFTGTSNPFFDDPVYSAERVMDGSPALGDINGDGKLELVTATNVVKAWALPNNKGVAAWPMFRGSPEHTGVVETPDLAPSIEILDTLMLSGGRKTYIVTFKENWSVAESDPQNVVSLNRTTGTRDDRLVLTITPPRRAGTFSASLTVRSPGAPTVTIPITVRTVPDLEHSYVPMIRR